MDSLYIDKMFKEVDENIVLDDEQKEVVLDESQNLIVIAGAGTGKTTTISAKVKYLVDVKKIKPEEILIISFTNKAITELKNRINIEFKIPAVISTFHKLAYDMIKEEDQRYKILSDSENLIKQIILKNANTNKIIKILRKNKEYRKQDNEYINNTELLVNLTCEIIQLIKILNIDLNKDYDEKITSKYVEYLKKIIDEYNAELFKKMYLDFEDLLIKASKLENINSKYKYIIVDEYQDVSINKLNFLKNLVSKTKAKTIVVGDDFQTIFSFAGSQINLFLTYQEMTNARLLKITKTYRNSQELIDVAGEFVMNNNSQIKKQLKSIKTLEKPIEIYGYKNDFSNIFEIILRKIINENDFKKTILILGRYKSDINYIKSRNLSIKNNEIIYLKNPKIKIDFMTIHASKGLGYDNVILVNFNNEYKGFPSNVENIFLKKKIIGLDKNLEEERRLFYVALTRTKNKVYILTKIGCESIFIHDIYNNPNVYLDYKFIIKRKNKHNIK